jgi:hypothetical protein
MRPRNTARPMPQITRKVPSSSVANRVMALGICIGLTPRVLRSVPGSAVVFFGQDIVFAWRCHGFPVSTARPRRTVMVRARTTSSGTGDSSSSTSDSRSETHRLVVLGAELAQHQAQAAGPLRQRERLPLAAA